MADEICSVEGCDRVADGWWCAEHRAEFHARAEQLDAMERDG